MMLAAPILSFALSFLAADEDFISHYEYGEMLYKSPRGVSCVSCHGDSGEGRMIIEYKDKEGKKQIKGSDIRQKSLAQMIQALNSYHDVMPRYYLTNDEIKAIYDFLQEKKKRINARKS